MGTRSRIGIKTEDGTITSIYCHWDGYPSHVGATLLEHYNTSEKVDELMKYGDRSSLSDIPNDGNDYTTLENGTPDGNKAITHDDMKDWVISGQDYDYLFIDNEWQYRSCGCNMFGMGGETTESFTTLTESICENN